MKKLLLLIKLPPPITGATLMNQYVAESLEIRQNFEVTVIGISYTANNDDLGKVRLGKIYKLFGYLIQLAKTLFNNRQDLVYFQISSSGNALVRDSAMVLLLKLFRIPVVYHIHAMDIGSGYRTWLKPFYNFVFKKGHLIHLTEMAALDIPGKLGSIVHVLPNTIPDRQVKKSSPEKKLRLLFISNLMQEKGIFDLLEICKMLRSVNVDFQLKIVGKEQDISVSDLKLKVIEMKLSGLVEILGPKYGSEKHLLIDQSDVLVFPTFYRKEVFPLVILEAMQAGLPAISYDHAGIPEVIDQNETGFIVPLRNTEIFAEKVAELAEDRALLMQMGKNARIKFMNSYHQKNFEKGLCQILRDTIT
jgi:glycosyltransferase involved in cell wall biosynthesis